MVIIRGDTAKGSKFCPIYEELNAIFTSIDKHCLLIDDARLFNGADDYPTLDELKGFILKTGLLPILLLKQILLVFCIKI